MIPYAIMWTGEDEEKEVRYCPYARQPAVHFKDDPGNTSPIYVIYHPQRSRRCVFEELCEVCGKPIQGPKISLSQAEIVDGLIKTNEPLCCVNCAKLATQICPEIKSQVKDNELLIREVISYEIAPSLENGVIYHLNPVIKQWRMRDLNWLKAAATPQPDQASQ